MRRILPVLLLAAACGGDPPPVATAPVPSHTYACGGEPVALTGLDGPPTTRLGPNGQAALKGGEVRAPADLEAWRIVEETDDRVALIRELDTPVQHGSILQTHQYLLIERYGRDDAWNLRMSGRCDLRQVVPGHGEAALAFASATGTRLNLWVTEKDCASGRPATGRIKLAALEETDQEVRVVVAVRPVDGSVTCQGNPRTPFTVELSRPLGDRTVVDAAVHPPRRL
ncbi:hypothetical protein GT755_24840 [Herbidospora sp. NEAU-GS84]|uniref:Uncharacterized protein n=1 Tax=Herbidospora solisilvae TaxID=2696284 RepID=A0A7C9JXK1_9ACTN|nr:hypothetical protein [Herbidospora solisilvae]NAS24899.1 hypothetical protein [Herbidospora solisilvae]